MFNSDENVDNDILNNMPKKRGRKPKDKVVVEKVVKKRGRKPTGKIFESLDTNVALPDCIITHLTLTDKDICKITGESIVEEVPKVQVVNRRQINFNLESDSDLKHNLNEKIKELEELKKKYDELDKKYTKYSFLESIVTDNGSIDKKYYIPDKSLISDNGETWNDSTDLWCTWCVHPFTTVPIGLPESYCKETGKYFTRECFCSFNCAHAYNISLNDYKVWERYSLLNRIKNQIFTDNSNIINKTITYAPPRQILKVFNGTKTIEEFRNNQISIPKEYSLLLPSIIPFFTVVEEIPKFFNKKINNNFDKLKLKRNKPLPMKTNNLMSLFDKSK